MYEEINIMRRHPCFVCYRYPYKTRILPSFKLSSVTWKFLPLLTTLSTIHMAHKQAAIGVTNYVYLVLIYQIYLKNLRCSAGNVIH